MTIGEDIAKFLIEQGCEYTASELAKQFGRTHNCIQSAMTSARRNCTLKETKRPSSNFGPQIYYMAIVDRGIGLLAMNKPVNKPNPYYTHKILKIND